MLPIELVEYLVRIGPALIIATVFFFAIPKNLSLFRLFGLILIFILFRDAMIPTNLWQISSAFEIRFIPRVMVLLGLALSSVTGVIFARRFIAGPPLVWFRHQGRFTIIIGIVAGFVVYAPVFLAQKLILNQILAPPREASVIAAVLLLCLLGNLFEEVLFRGYLINHLQEAGLSPGRTIFLSGLAFSVCHIFLGFTVTSIGYPILLFTLYEGLLCAYLTLRWGLLAASLAHGLGIFWIAIGLGT